MTVARRPASAGSSMPGIGWLPCSARSDGSVGTRASTRSIWLADRRKSWNSSRCPPSRDGGGTADRRVRELAQR